MGGGVKKSEETCTSYEFPFKAYWTFCDLKVIPKGIPQKSLYSQEFIRKKLCRSAF